MKFMNSLLKSKHLCVLILLLVFSTLVQANSVVVGGYVPPKHDLSIVTTYHAGVQEGDMVEIAEITINNNLPNYELVLTFQGPVDEVRLQGLDGTLGGGLTPPADMVMTPSSVEGQFIWSPGQQTSATLDYRVRVMIRLIGSPDFRPVMMATMPFSY